ncbi:NIPSNAP family protein [Flavitalea sp.]|nr:NIPSNAP family protein [Flavitalea sp.]
MKNVNRLYELRTYFANPGMLDKLVSRFEHHTFRFFAKHKMQVVGFWLPLDNPENKLVYILSFADQEACTKSWLAFKNDSEWMAIKEESSSHGELVASIKSVFMHKPDFLPD